MQKEFRKVEDLEVVKFENKGDEIIGAFVSIEQSELYADSYGLTFVDDSGKQKIIFVNKIALDKFTRSNIKKDDVFKLIFAGMIESQDKKRAYKSYELYI